MLLILCAAKQNISLIFISEIWSPLLYLDSKLRTWLNKTLAGDLVRPLINLNYIKYILLNP